VTFERNFAVGFAWRLLLLLAAVGAFALALWEPGLRAARLLAGVLAIGAVWSLWHYIGRTNRELARFVEALRYGDFSQGFGRTAGGGFDELGQALGDAMRQLRAERAQANEEARIHAALADESPAALLLVDDEGRVTLSNKAARKLFNRLAGTRIEDFAAYGPDLVAALEGGEAGVRKVVPLRIDNAAQRAMVSRASLDRLGRPLAIVAVQPIQQELSSVELAAQADLVRVLTHEIMNSMTPVVSLAESAARLMAQVASDGDSAITDARTAIETLARRAAGIMHFVEAYRAFSRAPVVEQRRFPAKPWAEELQRLFAASDAGRDVTLDLTVEPDDLALDADPDLLAQVVINLLKNGAEAAAGHSDAPRVSLAVRLLPGGKTMIAVGDNGPGIAPELAAEIFLPFFTTKSGGTGVGLSLARRIVTAHGGAIALGQSDAGALFEIVI
jgi:nitrogen fixation/metabolism regulation signal transduction histidine kinase